MSIYYVTKNKKLFFFLFFLTLLSFNSLHASVFEKTITGTVTDSNGEALIGVNVFAKGTSTGTSTDFEGKYSLSVADETTTLVFSYLGFKNVEANITSSVVDVVMREDSELIDEVVVVGYGVQKKSNLIGSIASIKGAELTKIVSGNPTAALQGKLAGVQVESFGGQPGGATNVFVRGVSSFTNSFPLYVIDGTFTDNMNFLNPMDIQSIEVLKDASSAAIYGSRAANGVVLVTTKRGGDGEGRPSISVDLRAGVENASRTLDYLSGPEFIDYRNQLELNDGTGFVLQNNGVDTDWQDLSLNSGGIYNLGMSVSGGDEKAGYYISGNYFNQDGILVGSGFERLNGRVNSHFEIGRLTINQSLSVTEAKLQENEWFGFEGSTAPILRLNAPENEGGFEAANRTDHNFAGINKYALASLEDNLRTDRNLLGNVNFSYQIAEGLSAKLNFGADYLNRFRYTFRPTYFLSPDDARFNVNDQNDLTEVRSETLLTLFEPTVNFNKTFGNIDLGVVAGYTRQKITSKSLGTYVQGLPNNETRVIGAAGPENVVAIGGNEFVSGLESLFGRVNIGINNKYLIEATMRRDASSKFAPDFRVGYFPSVSVGWRVSQESFFPSSGALTDMKLRAGFGTLGSQNIPDYSYQSVFNLTSGASFGGALRPGYAQTSFALENLQWEEAQTVNFGVDLGFWDGKFTLSAEYFNKDVKDVLVGIVPPGTSGFSNPVIQNAGKINNKGFELEGLYRKRDGDFQYAFGFNFATLTNKIIELPNPLIGPSTNEAIVSVNRFIEGQPLGVFWGFEIEGVYADQAAIDNDPNIANDDARRSAVQPGDFIRRDINGDGMVNGDDQTVLGNPNPDFTYGFNFTGSYKKLDFGLFFNGVQGNEIYNLNKFFNVFFADDNKLSIVQDSWTPSNTVTDIPRATTLDGASNSVPSSFFVEDGSYLRLRNLEIGYDLTGSVAASTFSSLRAFISVQNAFVLTKYSGYDPDVSSTNGGRSNENDGFYGNRPDVNPIFGRGLDSRAYPNTRGLLFGIQASF